MDTRKLAGNLLLVLTGLACVAALALSVYPGVLVDLLIAGVFLGFILVPITGVVALIAIVVLARRGRLGVLRIPWTRAAVVFALLCGTGVLVVLGVPRRIAFAASRASFEQLIAQAPASHTGNPRGRRVGVYLVDEYAADPRGGVYFRVYAGWDGIGPDVMSYGFAYKPNREGTPFGAADYGLSHLVDEWYCFAASDDW